jgi:hypothetical protein
MRTLREQGAAGKRAGDAKAPGGGPAVPAGSCAEAAGKGNEARGEAAAAGRGRILIIACGALAREIMDLKRQLGRADIDLHCLPATWHNTPRHIPEGVRARIRQARAEGYDRIFVAYGDCGTGGRLDEVLGEEGVDRLPGAHCYAFLTGNERFLAEAERDARSFFLTDYLVRHFDRLIWQGLMLDAHPELIRDCFGNYERLVYLAQRDDPELDALAREAARRLGLSYERRVVGYGDLEVALKTLAGQE